MTVREIFEKDKTLFDGWNFTQWDLYYRALNEETPVETVKDAPWFLELTENEKLCYVDDLIRLQKERERIPGVRYESMKYSWFD